jgi:hypothetical protein
LSVAAASAGVGQRQGALLVEIETGAVQFLFGDPATAAAAAEQLDVGVGLGVGGDDFDGEGVGEDRDGATDGPVLAVGVVVGELVEPGRGAVDGAGPGLSGGGSILIPRASKAYMLSWSE